MDHDIGHNKKANIYIRPSTYKLHYTSFSCQ